MDAVKISIVENVLSKLPQSVESTTEDLPIDELSHLSLLSKVGFRNRDLRSFVGKTWLTGEAVSMFLVSEARQQPFNNHPICTVFDTKLYHDIVQYTSSNIGLVRYHTLLHDANFLQSDILIPIHLPGHYNGAILSFTAQSIAVMDPYHTDQHRIVKALQR